MKPITLNTQQQEASRLLRKWWEKQEDQIFTVVGPPGTGKTTIIRKLMDDMGWEQDEILFVAFVGRAAQNMIINGLNAVTIHSAIYDYGETPVLDSNGEPVIENGRPLMKNYFTKREKLDPKYKAIVIDEGGTVDRVLGADLISFGLPIIVLGDLDQLPPVFGKSPFLRNPDVVLTEYMRQAEDSEIIWMSRMINEFKEVPYGKYNNSLVIPKSELTAEIAASVDMCITTRNKTRQQFNDELRRYHLGLEPDDLITIGDKVVCRNNDRSTVIRDPSIPNVDIYLVNGMIGYVKNVDLSTLTKTTVNIDIQPDFLEKSMFSNIPINLKYFNTPVFEKPTERIFEAQIQLSHAISTYMSQGSQYDTVLYYDDALGNREQRRAHIFTALTRAKKSVIYVR